MDLTRADDTGDREKLQVELVDQQGRAIGSCSVSQAHAAPGRLHRAFSVMLYDASGRVLLQQRAAVKTRFPLRWSNTCCGHPAPGQPTSDAGAVRLVAELGISASLREVGSFRYRASDPSTGRVEFEWDHVLVGLFDGRPTHPDPAEVADHRWVQIDELNARISSSPEIYTPWLAGVLDLVRDHIRET